MIGFFRNILIIIWGLIVSLFTKICHIKDRLMNDSTEDREAKIKRELNDWQVDMYAKSPFLHKIPEARIRQRRDELRRKYGAM